MAVFFVVNNLAVRDAKQPEVKYESAKLLEYEDSANKFIGENIMDAEILKIEAASLAEAQKAAQFYSSGITTTPVVVTEAQWKTS
jgi:hypothetical protein